MQLSTRLVSCRRLEYSLTGTVRLASELLTGILRTDLRSAAPTSACLSSRFVSMMRDVRLPTTFCMQGFSSTSALREFEAAYNYSHASATEARPSVLPTSSLSSSFLHAASPQHSFAPADAHARLPPAPLPASSSAAPLLSRLQVARLQTARPRRTDGPPAMPAVMQAVVAEGQAPRCIPRRCRRKLPFPWGGR